MRFETAYEIVTYHILEILTRNGVTFDPIIRTIGEERLRDAIERGRGVLMVAPHAMLSTLILHVLAGMQIEMEVVSPEPMLVLGTGAPVRILSPTPAFLLKVREVLRGNGVVGAMIDRDIVTTRSTYAVPTDRGPIVIADALMHVAFRTEASVVCFGAHLERGEIVITFDGPSADDSRSAEGITASFVSFLQKHVAGLRSR
ncbi:MAG TPA: hypothetical protein VGQ46_22920 [Thermoanaerobaculia bacterium]|nr:hypothetical protein [Thermoanaerobaculia bacterium]